MPSQPIVVETIGFDIAKRIEDLDARAAAIAHRAEVDLGAGQIRPHVVHEAGDRHSRVTCGEVEHLLRRAGARPRSTSDSGILALSRGQISLHMYSTASRFGNQFMPLAMIEVARNVAAPSCRK